jgi:hypothetical protein
MSPTRAPDPLAGLDASHLEESQPVELPAPPVGSLDELYGDGTAVRLQRVLEADKVDETPIPGGVRLDVRWGDAWWRVDCYPDRLYGQTLQARGKGIADRLKREVPGFFKPLGVAEYATEADPDTEGPLTADSGFRRVEGRAAGDIVALRWEF